MQQCRPDITHSDLAGVREQVNGSIILLLVRSKFWPACEAGAWDELASQQLIVASRQFNDFKRQHGLRTRVHQFTLKGLRVYSQASWPSLKAKAVDQQYVSMWLLDVFASTSIELPGFPSDTILRYRYETFQMQPHRLRF